jgi:hypothetical protein
MKAIVHGTGLIGSSVGLALAVQGWEVAGWDPDPQALEMAERLGAVARSLDGPGDGLDQVDLVVLAGPPRQPWIPHPDHPGLVTDVAGARSPSLPPPSCSPLTESRPTSQISMWDSGRSRRSTRFTLYTTSVSATRPSCGGW